MAIKAIIFDCFGVLVVPTTDQLIRDFPDKKTDIKDIAMQADYGYMTRDEYNQRAAELTGLSVEQFQARYWNNRMRNQAAFDWLNELRQQGGFRIGLLSNVSVWRMEDYIPAQERAQLFDAVVLSGEEGVVKPAIEIFEIAAQRLGVDVAECIMIDDILENVEGASRAGMKSILFTDTTAAQADLATLLEEDNA